MLEIKRVTTIAGKRIPLWSSILTPAGWLIILVAFALLWPIGAYSSTSQCFYAEDDTFASRQDPGQNFGNANVLEVTTCCDVGSDTRISYLWFNLDPIPEDATILSADLELYLAGIAPADGTTRTRLRAVNDRWSENTLTWDSRPGLSSTNLDSVTVDGAPQWFSWSADGLVSDWVGGARANHGLAVIADGFSALAQFRSKDGASPRRQPRLCVNWDLDVEADLAVTDIEVTQGTQDLNNSVRLVAGKPTYVRVHVEDRTGGNFRTFATLEVDNGAGSRILHPINENAGHIVVQSSPRRPVLNHAFLFRLPTHPAEFTQGTVNLHAAVNPTTDWRGRYPPETDLTNNTKSVTVEFEEVPRIGLVAYAVDYRVEVSEDTFVTQRTSFDDIDHMFSWLERAYPVSDIWYTRRRISFTDVTVDADGDLSLKAGEVNGLLKSLRQEHRDSDRFVGVVGDDKDIRYYGMVTDSAGFMRGKAKIGGNVGAGPTGGGTWGWDFDGSYGDWYGAHELGHNFGRRHAEFCGAKKGRSYPHDFGLISPVSSGDDAIYGFDLAPVSVSGVSRELRIYRWAWADVMTYCDNQWMSDFTYHGIMDFIQNKVDPLSAAASAAVQGTGVSDRLQVVGTIDPDTNAVQLQPLFVLPDAEDLEPRTPGDYAIVLRDQTGAELARYAFTPEEMSSGPRAPLTSTGEDESLFISELVPYADGTTRVDIEGPAGGVLTTVTAGINPPSIELVSPNGGEALSSDPVEVDWNASDPDGDPLTYRVQFSRDGGTTWEAVTQNLETTSAMVPRSNLPSTGEGLFRVTASDGIHTAADTSDGTFSLATLPPTAEIISPASGTFVSQNQSLILEVDAFSPNIGSLDDDQVIWASNIDGILGNGERVTMTGLTPGEHEIGVLVDDGVADLFKSVEPVIVVDNPTLLPALTAGLEHGPDHLQFRPGFGLDTQTVTVDNRSGRDSIGWSASAFTLGDEDWIVLDRKEGTTPAEIVVSVDTSGLEPGVFTGAIGLFNDAGGEAESVEVTLWNFEPGELPALIFKDSFE